ncbi:MAG: hypothetical protein EU539_08150 [Promethearchaeota archaeon]|nr:MAG: hypothetical protein EU539_08150 [Candidatus Lokiarchaeota archaeon]
MTDKEYSWTVKLDWLNILNYLGLNSIKEIPELKRRKAIKKLTRSFGSDGLLEFEPSELERLVAEELRDLMKKELAMREREQERIKKEFQDKFIPFKRGGIIKLDPKDLKDLDIDPSNPEDLIKAFKKIMGDKDKDDEKDKDPNFYEDKDGYYI